MGFNITGLLVKNVTAETQIENLLGCRITLIGEVGFEDATSSFREGNTIDVLQTSSGTLIIMELGQIYDISHSRDEVVQFIISDVSDTYYFEKYENGKLVRKYIYSQGEVVEDYGIGVIQENDDMMDIIWELTENFLQNNFLADMSEARFNRYKI